MKNLLNQRLVPIWAIQLGANLGLLAFAYWWLLWPDEHVWQVIASLIAAAGLVFVTAWLQTGTLSYLRNNSAIRVAFRHSLRCVPAFLVWAITFAIVLSAFTWIRSHVAQASVRGAQLTNGNPRQIHSLGDWIIAILQYVFVPAFFFVFISQIADRGFRGWHLRASRQLKELRYWSVFAIALLIGALLPYKLIWWIPVKASGVAAEAWSAGLRFGLAYLLGVSAWIAFARELSIYVISASPSSASNGGSPTEHA